MKGDLILDQIYDLSVDVNGLIVPGRSIEGVLSRHALNLVTVNDDDVFKVSLVGSATAIRYKDRELLLATQHQLKGWDESRVAMLTDSGSHAITSGGSRKYGLHSDTDAYDIVAFDFTEPCREFGELRRRFFDFKQIPPNVASDDMLALLLTGYPSAHQK